VDSPLEKGHGDAPAGTPGVSLEEGEIKATPLNTGAHSPSPPLNTGAHSPSTSGREDDAAAAAPPAAGQQATAAADGWRGFSLFGGPDGAPPPISFVFGATATATATPSRQQRGKRHRVGLQACMVSCSVRTRQPLLLARSKHTPPAAHDPCCRTRTAVMTAAGRPGSATP
jgi:hypothetical protein